MNLWQTVRQIKNLAEAREWEGDAANEKVFNVRITGGVTEAGFKDLRFPMLFISPVSAVADGEEPGIWTDTISIQIVQAVEGDIHGEQSMIGSNRSRGRGASAGRGILELEEELLEVLNILSAQNGIRIQVRSRSSGGVVFDETLGYITIKDIEFDAMTTLRRVYHPVTRFTAVDAAGAGDADLAWTLAPDRFDRDSVVVRRAAGASAPNSPSAGTGVTLGGSLATSVTDSPGAGQFSYAVFMAYDEGRGGALRFSPAATATVTVT